MTGRRASLLVVALALPLVAAAPAPAAVQPKTIARYCSETGDLCFGVLNRSGAVSLEITTFARYFDRYTLCVQPRRGAGACKSFPLRQSGRLFVSRVRWYRNFPPRGPGPYLVSWRLKGSPLGPQLKFRLPLS